MNNFIQSEKDRFQKAYVEVYTGILSKEFLDQRNPWFENFIEQSLKTQLSKVREVVENKKMKEGLMPLGYSKDPYNKALDDILQALEDKK